jgi:uncharacterized membrane protein YkvA (DUF1232 family)
VKGSQAFKAATAKAQAYAKDPKRLKGLFEDAAKKAKSAPRGPFEKTWAYFMAMLRLIRAYYNGTYTEIPVSSIVVVVGAVIYFVSPIDLIPDFIPVIGLTDDAAIIGFAVEAVQKDLDAFMEWENEQAA